MKTFRGTSLFTLFVAGLALISYFLVYQGEQRKNEAKDKASVLIPFKEDAITGVRVESEANNFELKKTDGLWHLTAPVNALADGTEVNHFLSALLGEKSMDQIRDDDSVAWNVFGLDKPAGSVTVTDQSGQSKKLMIGTRKTYSNDLYLRFEKENKVLLVSSMWTSHLAKDSKSLRDKQIYKGDAAKVSEIRIRSAKDGLVQLVRIEKGWQLKGDSQTKIDAAEVKKFLDQLKAMKALNFVVESHSDEADLKKYDLNSTQITQIELVPEGSKAGDATWSLKVSPVNPQGHAYLIASDMSPIIEIYKTSADQIQLGANDFRDKATPFEFKSHDVRKLTYRSPLFSTDLVKENGAWKQKDSKEGEEVAKDQVESLIKALGQLRVKKFLGSAKTKGLNPPKYLVALRDGEDKLLISVKWGDEFKEEKNPVPLVYATTSLIHENVGLDAAKIKELPGATLIKAKGEKQKAKEKPTKDAHAGT